MKCPHCNYEHGWHGGEMKTIKGEKGEFFTLSNNISAVRPDPIEFGNESRKIYGCPECLKLFIED